MFTNAPLYSIKFKNTCFRPRFFGESFSGKAFEEDETDKFVVEESDFFLRGFFAGTLVEPFTSESSLNCNHEIIK